MKLAIYALVSPLFVAYIVLFCVGLMVRGAWSTLTYGFTFPENNPVMRRVVKNWHAEQLRKTLARRQTYDRDPTKGPGGYHANL